MADEGRRFELFHDYRESGFDGKYECTTYYRLIIGEGNRTATATLEVEVVKRTFPDGPERRSLTRHQLKVEELVGIIQKHGKPEP